jgi:hypothetical protein
VLGNEPILNTENINNIKIESVAGWLDVKPFTTRVCPRSGAVHGYKIPFGMISSSS